jgi:O-antigen/teichoic acid export membrane protein
MPESKDHIRRDINRGAAISFAGNAFKLAEFLLTLLAARLFGVHVWGQYIFLNTLFLPVMRLACAGLDKGVIWYLSRHRGSRPPDGFFAWMRNRMLLIGAGLLLAFGAYRAFGFGKPSPGGLTEPVSLALMAAAVPFVMLTNLNLGISMAFKKMEHEVLVRGILYPICYLGLPCALAFLARGTRMLAAFYLLGSIGGWLASQALAAPLKRSLGGHPVTEHTEKAKAVLWHYSWPMGMRDVLLSLQQRVDIWCLALFLPPKAIGIYGLALSIANSIKTIRQAFDNILLAVISGLKRGADSTHIRDAYLHAGQTTLALQIPIFAFLAFFAGPLLALSGPEYAAGGTALLIFAFTLIIIGYLGLSGVVVLGMGKSRWAMVNDLICLALALLFTPVLVPRFGIAGAAMGTSLSILLTNLVWFGETIYLIRLVPLRPAVFANFAAGVGLTALSHWLWKRYGDPGLVSRGTWFLAFAAPYAGVLWVLFGKAWLARRRASAEPAAALSP